MSLRDFIFHLCRKGFGDNSEAARASGREEETGMSREGNRKELTILARLLGTFLAWKC
jgi:hypothetical protein